MKTGTPPRQLSLDIEEEVFKHLMFHKSIIDDSDEDLYERLNRYLQVLSELNEGVHVTIRDSYSRSIAMVLELATEEYLDPWDIDLVKFCRLFIRKLRDQERMDLVVVGKLIKMAYTVHLLKSENTLRKAELNDGEEPYDEECYYEWMENDESFEVTRSILQGKQPPIIESLLHKGERPVTLLDLLNALEEVETEVDILKRERRRRVENRKRMDDISRSDISTKIFKEHTEEEIKLTWQRINKFNGHPIPLSRIEEGFELDAGSTFISLLYLARDDMIRVWQRSFPRGEIMVKNVRRGDEALKYGELEDNLERAKKGSVEVEREAELVVEKRPIPNNWNT